MYAATVRVALLVLTVFGVLIAQADARTVRPDYIDAARAAWPGSPCEGRETITVLDDGQMLARYGPSPLGLPYGGMASEGCNVTMRAAIVDSGPGCYVLTHEFGHLAGHPHSDDPRSLMFSAAEHPGVTWDAVYEPCDRAAHPMTLRRARYAVRQHLPGEERVACRWHQRSETADCVARWREWRGKTITLRAVFRVSWRAVFPKVTRTRTLR